MGINTASDVFFVKNPNPMWIYEPETLELLAVNDAAPEIYGYEKEEMLSLTLRDLRPESEVGKLEKEVAKQVQDLNDSGIWLHKKKNGDRIHVRILSYPVQWNERRCKLVVAQDVTRQVDTSGELRMAEAKLEELYTKEKWKRLRFERINNRLSLLGKVGEIFAGEQTNHKRALEKIADLLVHEVVDICSFDILEDGELKRVVQQALNPEKKAISEEIRETYPEFFHNHTLLRNVMESGEPLLKKDIDENQLKQLVQNREQFELIRKLEIQSFFILPLKVKEEVIGVITMIILQGERNFAEDDPSFLTELADKTALHIENILINEQLRAFNRNLEEKVRERTRQLENMNEELESFSYSVSHDLRTPLRAIGGYSNLLIEDHLDQLDEDGQEFVSIIHSETARMGELIDDLLSFSRLSRKEKVHQNFRMEILVRQCIDELKQAFPEADPVYTLQELGVVSGDPQLLRQVWLNLISNAIKYQEKGAQPEITIGSCSGEEDEMVYFIRDNGVGFNMKYADKLFGVFQRLHSDDEFEGTGIGLALVRRIVNRHGGDVRVESEPGQGTTFYFTIPGNAN